MTIGDITALLRGGIAHVLILAAPLLLSALIVGLVVAILQATTSIQEQTLTFVPKLLGISLMLMIMGPWMITTITEFMYRVMEAIVILV